MPQRADPAFAGDRLVDDAEDRPAVLQQRDQRAEDRAAGHEADGAVDRVEHPLARGFGALGAIFLADDAVARRLGVEQAAHRGFGGAVGLGDGRGVGLGFVDPVRTKERTDRFAGGVGEAVGEGEVRGDRHGFALAQCGPRRQSMQSYYIPSGPDFIDFTNMI